MRQVKRIIAIIMIVVLCGFICYLSDKLPDIGDPDSPPATHVSDYYIEHSEEDTGSPNVVSATLADYRGFDTMWETTVMFISGLAVVLILTWDHKKKEKE